MNAGSLFAPPRPLSWTTKNRSHPPIYSTYITDCGWRDLLAPDRFLLSAHSAYFKRYSLLRITFREYELSLSPSPLFSLFSRSSPPFFDFPQQTRAAYILPILPSLIACGCSIRGPSHFRLFIHFTEFVDPLAYLVSHTHTPPNYVTFTQTALKIHSQEPSFFSIVPYLVCRFISSS